MNTNQSQGRCSLCGSLWHTHLHCYGTQEQAAHDAKMDAAPTSKSQSTAEDLRRIAADAQLVGYRSAAQVALLVGADEIDRLRAALEKLYDKWENGDPCYEDADPTSNYMGNAFQLSMDEENEILALIPKFPSETKGKL